ncbi:MAG: diguanylate cyclase [Acidobacteriota bacterium]
MAKILLVEDSATQAFKVQHALRSGGHTAVIAVDGEEGRDKFLDEKPDLVLMDIVLPKKDGLTLCREIKAFPGQTFTPVILLTNQGDVASKVKGFEMGADDYLTKPFDNQELLARVKSMLRIKELQDELRRLVNHLELISTIDELTQLPNRRSFNETLAVEYERSRRFKQDMALVMIDIDHFKRINDAYGHPYGDYVLREVANALRKNVRKVDLAARYGGEEFAVLLPSTPRENAGVLAEKLRKAVESLSFEHDGDPVSVTISLGVCDFRHCRPQDPEELVQMADASLYQAKRNGRNCVRLCEQPEL